MAIKSMIRAFDQAAFFNNQFSDSEVDRSLALLGGALLDDDLKRLIENNLIPEMRELTKRSLRNFDTRIDICFGLKWIDKDAHHDLKIIKDIRNAFAHFTDHQMCFSDTNISVECEKLASAKTLLQELDKKCATGYGGCSPSTMTMMVAPLREPRRMFNMAIGMLHDYIEQSIAATTQASFLDMPRNFARDFKPIATAG